MMLVPPLASDNEGEVRATVQLPTLAASKSAADNAYRAIQQKLKPPP